MVLCLYFRALFAVAAPSSQMPSSTSRLTGTPSRFSRSDVSRADAARWPGEGSHSGFTSASGTPVRIKRNSLDSAAAVDRNDATAQKLFPNSDVM